MEQEKITTIKLYIGDSVISGHFKGTPEEIQSYISNKDNTDLTLIGEANYDSSDEKEIVSIPIQVLQSNVYQLSKHVTKEEFYENYERLRALKESGVI